MLQTTAKIATLWTLVILLALAAVPVAGAQPTPAPEPSDEESADDADPMATEEETLLVQGSLPYVPTSNTIATKLPVELAWTPANVGLVSSLLMDEQGALVLGDALENVSGMNVQTGSGVFDYFVVRGFDSLSSGLILTDGAPEPETTFYQMYNAERVEVFKGPTGFLYGSNPLAGAVNIVRKQPVPANFGTVGLGFGSHDTATATFDLNAASSSGELSFRLNGLWRESDGFRDGVDSEATAVNPALTWRPNENTSLNVNYELLSSDFRPDAGLPVAGDTLLDLPRERSYASPFDRSEQDLQRFQVDYETRFSESFALRNKFYYRELDWLSDGTLFTGLFPSPVGGLDLFRTQVQLDDQQSFLGNQIEGVWKLETGGVTHNVVAGLEVGLLEDEYTLGVFFLPAIDVFAPVETAERPLFPVPGQGMVGDSETTVVAPYVIDQITVNDRLQFLVGARYDSIDFEDAANGTERSDGELSPMLGVVVAASDSLSLYANAGRSFAPPSVRVVGERKPEESEQIEVGLRKELAGGRVKTTFALFQIERQNIAIPDDNGFTQQAGDQRSRGVEVEANADLGNGWRTFLAYAYTDSELTRFTEQVLVGFFPPTFATLDRSGNASAFAPEHLVNLWVSKRFGSRFSVAGGARYVGSQFIAENNLFELDDYAVLDAALTYDWGQTRWTLNVENLLDEEYETRGFGSASVIPGRPLGAILGFEYRFGS